MKQPLVSIIIPSRNQANDLLDTLSSIYSQDYINYEIILVDDNSSDNTLELVSEIYGEKENLKYILNDIFIGQGASFNTGLKQAQGCYIAFAMPSDIWKKNKLSHQIDFLCNNKQYTGVCSQIKKLTCDNTYNILPDTSAINESFFEGNLQPLFFLDDNLYIGTFILNSALFENQLIRFDDELIYNAAYEFICNISGQLNLYCIKQPLITTSVDSLSTCNAHDFSNTCYKILTLQEQLLDKYIIKEQYLDILLKKASQSKILPDLLSTLYNSDTYRDILRKKYTTQKNSYAQPIDEKHTNISIVNQCIGCNNCINTCPVNALKMEPGSNGFSYPAVDTSLCISCGKCLSVCPVCNEIPGQKYQSKCVAAQASNETRMKASSGGIFPLLSDLILANNGYIAGALWTNSFELQHKVSNDPYIVRQMYKSKYLQSNLQDCFPKIKNLLVQGNIVLFSGTPCQCAALTCFLGGDFPNLYKVAVACHGVPSPDLFKKYISSLEEEHGTIKQIDFRSKEKLGWGSGLYVEFESGETMIEKSTNNIYINSFLSDLNLRNCCYDCKYKSLQYSDLLIGDFWGIEKISDMEDGLGTSYISATPQKGELLLETISPLLQKKDSYDNEIAFILNSSLKSSAHHTKTSDIIQKYINSYNLQQAIEKTVDDIRFDVALALYWSSNYGNALTNYALYTAIKDMGYNVVVLDNMCSMEPEGAFLDFAKMNYKCSSEYLPKKNYSYIDSFANSFVVGSDQSWNNSEAISHGTDNYFQLDFVSSSKHKKIAYAPSFGASCEYSTDPLKIRLFQDFTSISVREAYGVDICKKAYDMDATLVADPVFLPNPDNYYMLAEKACIDINTPFICAYILDPTDEKVNLCKNMAQIKGIPYYIIIDAVPGNRLCNMKKCNFENCLHDLTPEQWIAYMCKCDFMITDSFHGTCFAGIFQKDFIAIKNRQTERFNVFNGFGDMNKRIFDSEKNINTNIINTPLNYEQISLDIMQYSDFSRDWLMRALR